MIAESQWPEVLAALNMLRREATRPAPSPEYFLWLVNVLGKLVLLQLPIEIEQLIDQKNFDLALYFMKLLGYQFGFTCGVLEEPSIHSNLIMWLAELMIPLPELMKPEGEAIVESIRQKKPMPEYTKMLPEVPKVHHKLNLGAGGSVGSYGLYRAHVELRQAGGRVDKRHGSGSGTCLSKAKSKF
jgi:hypothetical protein